MDQMRIDVWDLVFQSGPQTIAQIVATTQLDQQIVEAVVNHAWFDVQGDIVSIAASSTPQVPKDA